jgi:hypothetical protein
MNFAAFERAQVAAFAYREARRTGNLDCMRAVCFILRNRVKSSWGDGTWLSILASSYLHSAGWEPFVPGEMVPNSDAPAPGAMITGFKSDDRLLQLMVRDVDDIYLGQDNFDDRVRQTVCGDDSSLKPGKREFKPVLYYCFVDRDPRPWFKENIIRRPQDHPQVGQIGTMMLFR